MFSMLNRIRAGMFVRVFVLAAVISVTSTCIIPHAVAREKKRQLYVHPGDGDGVGGFKQFQEPNLQPVAEDSAASESVVWQRKGMSKRFAILFLRYQIITLIRR